MVVLLPSLVILPSPHSTTHRLSCLVSIVSHTSRLYFFAISAWDWLMYACPFTNEKYEASSLEKTGLKKIWSVTIRTMKARIKSINLFFSFNIFRYISDTWNIVRIYMKRQYVFLVLIIIILYILYLILVYKYKEFQINSQIEYLQSLKTEVEWQIETAENLITYKTTKAYRNKILKEQQWLKNKGEEVVYLTTEEKYKKFTQPQPSNQAKKTFEEELTPEQKLIKWMSNYQRWLYFLFKKT